MKREDILYNVLSEIAGEGNEKAKLALRLTERPSTITVEKVFSELTTAMDKSNKAATKINDGYYGAAKVMLDEMRMHILSATTTLSQL